MSSDPRSRADLHGLTRPEAIRRVRETLIRARALGAGEVELVTGRGLSNRTGEPVLRGAVEAWLGSPEAAEFGIVQVERTHGGGALRVRLRRRA